MVALVEMLYLRCALMRMCCLSGESLLFFAYVLGVIVSALQLQCIELSWPQYKIFHAPKLCFPCVRLQESGAWHNVS